MGESEADIVGDEEVEVQDEGATAGATPEAGVTDMIDEEIKVQDEGATARVTSEEGVTDTAWDPKDPILESADGNPSTALTSVAVPTPVEEVMPDLKDSGFKESQAEEPQIESPPAEMHPVIPWVRFEAQISQDEGSDVHVVLPHIL